MDTSSLESGNEVFACRRIQGKKRIPVWHGMGLLAAIETKPREQHFAFKRGSKSKELARECDRGGVKPSANTVSYKKAMRITKEANGSASTNSRSCSIIPGPSDEKRPRGRPPTGKIRVLLKLTPETDKLLYRRIHCRSSFCPLFLPLSPFSDGAFRIFAFRNTLPRSCSRFWLRAFSRRDLAKFMT